jgi:hypothetical protein
MTALALFHTVGAVLFFEHPVAVIVLVPPTWPIPAVRIPEE